MIREVHRRLIVLPDARLWAAIFFGRALLVLLIVAILRVVTPEQIGYPPNFGDLLGSTYQLMYVFVLAPICETLFECSLPHLVMRGSVSKHPWAFAAISASLMVLIHPIGLTLSLGPTMTGLLLAYCYLSFYRRHSKAVAFAATCAMHAAINVAGVGAAGLAWIGKNAA